MTGTSVGCCCGCCVWTWGGVGTDIGSLSGCCNIDGFLDGITTIRLVFFFLASSAASSFNAWARVDGRRIDGSGCGFTFNPGIVPCVIGFGLFHAFNDSLGMSKHWT